MKLLTLSAFIVIAALGVGFLTSETALACNGGECVTPTVEPTPTPEPATLRILKDTDPETNGVEFDFVIREVVIGENPEIDTFDLEDDGDVVFSLSAGVYEIEEFATDNWVLTEIDCTDGADVSDEDVSDRDIRINLNAGEVVTCVFRNAPVLIPTLTPLPTSTPVPPTAVPTTVPTATPTQVPAPIVPPSTGDAGLL